MGIDVEEAAATRALTEEQLNEFREQGFLRIGKILDDQAINLLRVQYDHEFELARSGKKGFRNLAIDDGGDLDAKNQADQQMLQIMQMCERNIHFRELLYNKTILDMIEDLLGPNIQLFHDQAFYKPAGNGSPVFWHQDNGYWRCTPANLISCWITLDDVTIENGAMQLIPASHFRIQKHERSSQTNALFDNKDKIDSSKAVVVDLPAGGAMIHHCQTFHYTGPNTSQQQRRAFAIHFMTPGTRLLKTGKEMPVSFKRPMLRMG